MNKKYEVTGETKIVAGITLKRIRRLSDSEIGGWIEGEFNLSVSGNAWVYGNAQVSGNARVSGDALITKTPINIIGLPYNITITDSNMAIGCHVKEHAEWIAMSKNDIQKLDGNSSAEFAKWFRHTLIDMIKYHTK